MYVAGRQHTANAEDRILVFWILYKYILIPLKGFILFHSHGSDRLDRHSQCHVVSIKSRK